MLLGCVLKHCYFCLAGETLASPRLPSFSLSGLLHQGEWILEVHCEGDRQVCGACWSARLAYLVNSSVVRDSLKKGWRQGGRGRRSS